MSLITATSDAATTVVVTPLSFGQAQFFRLLLCHTKVPAGVADMKVEVEFFTKKLAPPHL